MAQCRSRARLALVALAAGAGSIVGPAALSAQVAQVRLLDDAGQALPPAIVSALDSTGAELRRLTSPVSGRFQLVLPHAGRYRLRVARIGQRPWLSGWFDVGNEAPVRVEFALPLDPVVLATLEVRASERACDAHAPPDEASATLLTQALTGLEIISGGLRFDPPRLRMVHWEAGLDSLLRTTALRQWPEVATATWPFASAPLARLQAHGFVDRPSELSFEDITYFAPDPPALGSPWFLAANCFTLAPGAAADPDVLGVAFRSLAGAGGSDLAGTLWLDRATLVLRRLEFRFVGPDPYDPAHHAGGEIHFARAIDGRLLPVAWRLRAAVPLIGRAGTGTGVAGYHERGGFVTTASIASTEILSIPPGSLVAVPPAPARPEPR